MEKNPQNLTISLSYWQNGGPPSYLRNRTVTVSVEGQRVVQATEYRIDVDHANPLLEWKQMGSPPQPSATQLNQLKLSARVNGRGVQVVDEKVSVMMSPNTALVLALQTDSLAVNSPVVNSLLVN